MSKVLIWADLNDELYRAYEEEARRRGIALESLVEKTVNRLLVEMKRELDGEDHPITPS
jgi:hypothetical protein